MTKEDIIRLCERQGIVIAGDAVFKLCELVAAVEREAMVKKDLTIDSAYRERNQLVALLSTCFPAGKAKTNIEGWDEAWHGCVYIDFPWGQASWHYHERDGWMFEHLPRYQKQWDGHTTEQKYSAIAQAIRARGEKLSSQDNLTKSPINRRYTCHVCNRQEMVRAKFDEESG